MVAHNSDACFYVAAEPIIAIDDGMFTVTYFAGEWRFSVAMPPRVFLKALRAANELAGEFEDGRRNTVVPIRADEEAGHG